MFTRGRVHFLRYKPVDRLQFRTLATRLLLRVFSSVVVDEPSGGAMISDISLAQNDVDNFRVFWPCRARSLKFSDKPGMILESFSVVSGSCTPRADLLAPELSDEPDAAVPAENRIMKEPTHWTKSPKFPSNSPLFRVSGVADRASAITAVQSERLSSRKLSGFDRRLVA